jgi:hypothetical protein
MPRVFEATPQVSVLLYKTIARDAVDGQTPVSSRYKGKDTVIDLTPFLQLGSAVRTTKSVRAPAGGFSISFSDKPSKTAPTLSSEDLESVAGLVEPMDVVEIRMWRGTGQRDSKTPFPIIMRGFVSSIQRTEVVDGNGRPNRTVVIAGLDYGKIWQTFQVMHLAAYAQGSALLTSYPLSELFGSAVKNVYTSSEFMRSLVGTVINPHIKGLLPEETPLPTALILDDISVKHGTISNAFMQQEGSIYQLLCYHGDIGNWNELYVEDREDGVHCVYRPIPALHLTAPDGGDRRIQDDAPAPTYCVIVDSEISALSTARSDAGVANFFWVNAAKYDLIDDMMRKLHAVRSDDPKVSLNTYPNSETKYYGVRAMMAETQQGADDIISGTSGLESAENTRRGGLQYGWIDQRRSALVAMNKDNVILESGVMRVKGGPLRPDGSPMKAGDYARVKRGSLEWDAYVVQIDHEFTPFQTYVTTLTFERGEGFARRITIGGGKQSPWIAEQASRPGSN